MWDPCSLRRHPNDSGAAAAQPLAATSPSPTPVAVRADTSCWSLGIDVGTQGVRCVAIDDSGAVQARSSVPIAAVVQSGPQEQDPRVWWTAVADAISLLGSASISPVRRLAFSCTSGTLCPLGTDGEPTHPAILYSDPRTASSDHFPQGFAANSIHWMLQTRPAQATALWTSPAGYLAQQLTGRPAPIDTSQALKMGFQPATNQWSTKLAVDRDSLPQVVDTGTAIGYVSAPTAERLGLNGAVEVIVGSTDGVAAHLATAPMAGRMATSVGSTIVWKTVANTPIEDREMGVYSHRSPDGTWLPGAASNSGARILSSWFSEAQLASLDSTLSSAAPAALIYPSLTTGERFPFSNASFVPFLTEGLTSQQRFDAAAWAVAAIERRGIEVLTSMGVPGPAEIATTGATTAARNWLQLRSDMSGMRIKVPKEPSSAFGAAIVASCEAPSKLIERSHECVRWERTFWPRDHMRSRVDDYYLAFVDLLASATQCPVQPQPSHNP